jgi:DNA-binding NtrC family response regulator
LPASNRDFVRKPAHLLSPRVLIVEDEPRMRELLLEVIPPMGFTAVSARAAEEALRLMEADPSELLLLDLQLPGMGGMEFFERVRRRWPATQVIIMTGFGDLESARQAIRLDVVDFVTKPFHLRDIEVALDRARNRMVEEITTAQLPEAPEPSEARTLADAERQAILAALERHAGNRTAAALELGISRRKLHYWLSANPIERD